MCDCESALSRYPFSLLHRRLFLILYSNVNLFIFLLFSKDDRSRSVFCVTEEIEELSGRLKASRQRLSELEKSYTSASSANQKKELVSNSLWHCKCLWKVKKIPQKNITMEVGWRVHISDCIFCVHKIVPK